MASASYCHPQGRRAMGTVCACTCRWDTRKRFCVADGDGAGALEQADDEAKETNGRCKDLNDENLDEQRGVVGVRERCAAPADADGDAAKQV